MKIFLRNQQTKISRFTFSVNFCCFSVYDDIIKLTMEHLTFTLVAWEIPQCSLANRKINIHSCIQRTWLLLCEFYTIFCFFFPWDLRGWKDKLFFFYHSEVFSVFFVFWQYRFMYVIYIQLKPFLGLLESLSPFPSNSALPHGTFLFGINKFRSCWTHPTL